ncbi:MAG: MFS transporter [Phycisphaerae bacterium]
MTAEPSGNSRSAAETPASPETVAVEKPASPKSLVERLLDFLGAFKDLLGLPAGFWVVVFTFVIESMAYFGVLTLMNSYLTRDLGIADKYASSFVSVFTMLVTLFMLGAGSYAESFGLRRAILAALVLCLVGRILYSIVPGLGMSAIITIVIGSLLIVALGEAILQPVCYSGVKQYTDEKTSSMGYGLIYALMNAGIVVVGGLSAWIRPGVQDVLDGVKATATNPAASVPKGDLVTGWFAGWTGSGIQAVNWVCAGITAVTLVGFLLCMSRRVEVNKLRPDTAEQQRERRKREKRSIVDGIWEYITEGPFGNARFIFFIFMLLPVRTLFAHQWLTMPEYILRAYPKDVGDYMEWLVNWINPAIIFVGVPIVTALTRHVNVYTMMILGSLVSAAPTFLLCSGPNLTMLITYFFLFSIGEAMWSARFLEYASELAPPGRLAQYMGLANIPWLLAKGTTGFYSGLMLSKYCPAGAPPEQLHTETLWFIYGCIAMVTPIGLVLARKWVMSGLMAHKPSHAAA